MTTQIKCVCLVFGSGASYDSGYEHSQFENANGGVLKPPLDCKFFDKKEGIHESLYQEYPAINLLRSTIPAVISLEENYSFRDCGYKLRNPLEELTKGQFRRIDNFIKKIGYKNRTDFLDAIAYLNQRYQAEMPRHIDIKLRDSLSHMFTGDLGREFRMLISKIYNTSNYKPNGKDNYESIFQMLKDRLKFCISFNYDIFARKSLNKVFDANGTKPDLYYFHGSLDWKYDSELKQIEQVTGKEAECDYSNKDGKNIYKEPCIVPPATIKENLENLNSEEECEKIEGKDKVGAKICREHEGIKKSLSSITKIIFIGYSLPKADEYAIEFFKKVIGKTQEISVCDFAKSSEEDEKRKSIKCNFSSILNEDLKDEDICLHGFSGFVNNESNCEHFTKWLSS